MPKELDGREKTILDSINEGVFTADLDWKITSFNRAAELGPSGPSGLGAGNPTSVQAMEKSLVIEELRHHKGSRSKAAMQLGINPSTLYRKLKALKIDFQKEVISKQRQMSVKKAAKGRGN